MSLRGERRGEEWDRNGDGEGVQGEGHAIVGFAFPLSFFGVRI